MSDTSGKPHRVDGPAVKNAIYQGWYINGKLHREDGPAVIHINTQVCEWWTDGEFILSDKMEQKQIDGWLEK